MHLCDDQCRLDSRRGEIVRAKLSQWAFVRTIAGFLNVLLSNKSITLSATAGVAVTVDARSARPSTDGGKAPNGPGGTVRGSEAAIIRQVCIIASLTTFCPVHAE